MANDLDPRLTPAQRFGRELARMRRSDVSSQVALGEHSGCSPSLIAHVEVSAESARRQVKGEPLQGLKAGNRVEIADVQRRIFGKDLVPSASIVARRLLVIGRTVAVRPSGHRALIA